MPEAPQDSFSLPRIAAAEALAPRRRPAEATSALTLRDLAAVAFYHRRALLLGLGLPLLLALGATRLVSTSYDAEARLLVLVGRDTTGEGGNAGAAAAPDQARAIQTEVELISSPAVLAAALQAMPAGSLAGPPLAEDQAVAQVARRVRISVAPNSNVLRVQFSDPSPVVAADLVNTLVQAYLAQRRQVFARSQSEFLAEQRDQAAARLHALTGRVEQLKRQHNIIDAARERGDLLGRQHEIAVARQNAETRGRVLALELAATSRQLAGLPQELVIQREASRQPLNEYRRGILQNLEDERRRQGHAAGSTTGNTAGNTHGSGTAELDRRIATLRAAQDRDTETNGEQRRMGRNPQYETLALERARRGAEAEGLRALQQGLTREAATHDARLAVLAASEAQLGQLARQVQIEEQTYLDYARRTEDARVQEDAARRREANVRQIQAAEPASKGRNLAANLLVAGLASGLMLAPLLVLVAARLRREFIMPAEVEQALRLPLLAAFWAQGEPAEPVVAGRRRTVRFAAPGRSTGDASATRANLAASARLAHHILARMVQGTGNVLHLAAEPAASQPTRLVSEMLATTIAALSPHRVLLLDRDWQAGAGAVLLPVASTDLGLPPEDALEPLPGLVRLDGSRLHVAAPEALAALAARLGPASGTLLGTLRAHFGMIIINGTGFDADLASLSLAAGADEAVLVVAAERSGRQASRELIRKLEDLGCTVLGSVLANRRHYVPAFLYKLL